VAAIATTCCLRSRSARQLWHQLSLQGDSTLIGAPGSNSGNGAAYVFDRDASGIWNQSAKLTVPYPTLQFPPGFGSVVSLSGTTAAITAPAEQIPYDSTGDYSYGAVCIFDKDTSSSWVQAAKLVAHDQVWPEAFGSSMALSGSTLLATAPDKKVNGLDGAGQVYAFERSGDGSWVESAHLLPNDLSAYKHFGSSISISGNYVLIGADNSQVGVQEAAYLFQKDAAGHWSQVFKFGSPTGDAHILFGYSVALDGDWAVIGAPFSQQNGSTGSAYVYHRDASGSWSQIAQLFQSAANVQGNLGISASLSGTTAFFGSLSLSSTFSSHGAASEFRLDPIDGDFNDDGIVDGADYTIWRDTLGKRGTLLAADADLNKVVNAADYGVWRDHFGATRGGAGAAASVPEPSSLLLVAAGAISVLTSLALNRGH
jgi:hypothetical protein